MYLPPPGCVSRRAVPVFGPRYREGNFSLADWGDKGRYAQRAVRLGQLLAVVPDNPEGAVWGKGFSPSMPLAVMARRKPLPVILAGLGRCALDVVPLAMQSPSLFRPTAFHAPAGHPVYQVKP